MNGIQEKTRHLPQPASLGPGDIAKWTAEDHLRYFTTYVLTLLHDFSAYTSQSEAENGAVNMLSERAGYREVAFFATKQELDVAFGKVNEAIIPLIKNEAGAGRRMYKLATILHPHDL